MMSTSSSLLPTTPIGRQQVIDLKAGAILRENARKSGLLFGCPLGVVLVLIVLVKCLFISFWIIREYESFDFRCAAFNGEKLESNYRMKRWAENSDPRAFSKNPEDEEDDEEIRTVIQRNHNKKPLYSRSTSSSSGSMTSPKIDARLDFGPLPPNFQRRVDSNHIPEIDHRSDDDELPMTTMVTLTNTQIVPLSGDGVVKMKTIRNRVEKIGSDEEQFVEIDIANAPRIYVSKIKSRQGGEENQQDFDLFGDLKRSDSEDVTTTTTEIPKTTTTKKKKGKGLKKAKKLKALQAAKEAEEAASAVAKKKGKGSKKGSKKGSRIQEDVTKQPRHLVGKSSSVSPTPVPRSPSSWINGVIDPADPNFSNQGEIRGYPMQKASRRPQPFGDTEKTTPSTPLSSLEEQKELKISESTRMMWDMDELKYTTFMAPKTTEATRFGGGEGGKENGGGDDRSGLRGEKIGGGNGNGREKMEEKEATTTERPLPGGMSKTEWEQKKEAFEAYTPPLDVNLNQNPTSSPQHVFFLPSTTTTSSPPSGASQRLLNYPLFTAAPSEAPYYVEVNEADTETIFVKDVTPMYRGILMQPQPETTTRPYDPLHLEMEIAKLKESSTCLARMAFDIWCLFVLFSSVPFVMGTCVPRWSLFVLHIVFDFLFLVVGFVTSLTIAIMASIMYFLIEEMTSDTLFEFLLVAFVIDIVLILYAIIVGVAYRCCCRLVDNSIKDSSINYSVSTNGEPV